MVYSIVYTSAIKHHVRGQYLNWDSKNVVKRILILLKCKYFFILNNVDNFLFAFKQTLQDQGSLVQSQLWLQLGAVTPIHSIKGDFNSVSVSVPGMNA